jgi:hypothetical protein
MVPVHIEEVLGPPAEPARVDLDVAAGSVEDEELQIIGDVSSRSGEQLFNDDLPRHLAVGPLPVGPLTVELRHPALGKPGQVSAVERLRPHVTVLPTSRVGGQRGIRRSPLRHDHGSTAPVGGLDHVRVGQSEGQQIPWFGGDGIGHREELCPDAGGHVLAHRGLVGEAD